MNRSKLAFGLALVGTMLLPLQAQSQTSLTPDTWFTFSWDATGTVSTQYTATTTSLLVVDCCIVGDMFEVFSGATSLGQTSSVDPSSGIDTGAVTGDQAWADSRLSKGIFTVGIGDLITIVRTQQAEQFATGDGFVKSVTTVTTPEPGTVALFLVGLLGLAFAGARRERLLQA